MIGASISGVTFVSVPGMVRSMDMTYMQTVFGFFFGYLVVAHVLLPMYYRLNLTSIYSYLGTRIGVQTYRTGAFFFLLSRMLGTAAKLYLVCLILHTYVFGHMGIPFWAIAAGSVALVWVYTHKSGIKTIVWTDTLQTFCLIAALISIIYFTIQKLDTGDGGIMTMIGNSPHSRVFVFDDWMSRQNFFKQFLSGIFIVIVMTGLDQDMMQKNLSCKNLREAQKNMYCYGFSFIPLNLLFLCLGILLLTLAGQMNLALPEVNDDILPLFATQGYLGQTVLVLFTIGIIAAAFSNSDSALTAMTTSVCVDLLRTDRDVEEVALRRRGKVHITLSVILVFFICLVEALNSKSVIDAIYIIASYTYGPLLGMFAFGLFTRRRTRDRWVPFIAVVSPILCYALDRFVMQSYGYKFGYELLMLNGMLTFAGMYALSSKELKNKEHGNIKC
jgi:sodium:solute symporter family protein